MNSEKFKVWYYTKPLWLLLNLFSVLLGKAKRHKYLLPGQKTPYFSSLISYILKTWLVMIFKCLIWSLFPILWASLVTHMVKNLPAMQDQVWSVGQKDPVEKGMTTHSSILAGEFHGQRNLAGYSPWGPKESDTTERLNWTEQLNDKWRWATNIFYLHLGLADSQRERATESRTGAREKRWSVETWLTQGKVCWSRARVDP